MRKICVEEGERRDSGDVLALLTTDASEAISDRNPTLPHTSRFRLVPNSVEYQPACPSLLTDEAAKREKALAERKLAGDKFLMIWSDPPHEKRIGIYALGGCDLPAVFGCGPLIHPLLKGVCGIAYQGHISQGRSDLLLQTMSPLPWDAVNTVIQKMQMDPEIFQPRLAEKSFVLPGIDGPEEFPKTVTLLSIGADVTRVLYRHRETGFLVDPGGLWFNRPLDDVLAGVAESTSWFRQNFESIGKIRVEEFAENFTRIIELLKTNGQEHILVPNLLTVEPGSLTHNYQFVKNSESIRRLEFNLALLELSRKLDFPIVDVDRLVKSVGIRTQRDWSHTDPLVSILVAQEMVRIMQERGVL